MKICEIMAGNEEGGLENHFIDLANALVRKHEVHVIAHNRYADRFSDDVNFHSLDLSRSRKNPLTLYRLLSIVRTIKPDVVHAHANKAAAMIAVLRRLMPCPCVATIHSLKRNTDMFERFDHLIAVSKGVASGIKNKALTVIYNGRNLPSRISRSAFDVAASSITITFIGRLVHVKGVDVLLKAFDKVDNRNAHLQIIGDGGARHTLESMVRELGLKKRVSFLGVRNDIESVLAETDLVVIASRREGFPLVLVEALLSRRPVVSTRVPGACEILPEEVLAEIENPESLAGRLNWALDNLNRLDSIFAPIFQFAGTVLTHDHQVSATETVLKHVAEKGRQCAS